MKASHFVCFAYWLTLILEERLLSVANTYDKREDFNAKTSREAKHDEEKYEESHDEEKYDESDDEERYDESHDEVHEGHSPSFKRKRAISAHESGKQGHKKLNKIKGNDPTMPGNISGDDDDPLTIFPDSEYLPFSSEEKKNILDLHKYHRSKPSVPAGDMMYVEWSDRIEEVARNYSKMCGIIASDYIAKDLGFAIYTGNAKDPNTAVMSWVEEEIDFDFYEWTCKKGKSCNNIIQLYWAETTSIGCARHECRTATFQYIISCFYGPRKYMEQIRGFTIGLPCSRCSFKTNGFCYKNQCALPSVCGGETVCNCPLVCRNCGRLNTTSCSCKCLDGWDGLDCSAPCTNYHKWCDAMDLSPAVEDQMHCDQSYAVKHDTCRKMCGMCKDTRQTMNEKLCCNGLICKEGYILNLQTCKCELLCPSIACKTSGESETRRIPRFFSNELLWKTSLAPIFWYFFVK